MWIEWNDLYDELGLDRVLLGDSMGWNVNRPLEIIPKGESYGDTYESLHRTHLPEPAIREIQRSISSQHLHTL